mgnify:CR=1 FL=1
MTRIAFACIGLAGVLAACDGFKEAMTAHVDVVARAGSQELSVTRLAELQQREAEGAPAQEDREADKDREDHDRHQLGEHQHPDMRAGVQDTSSSLDAGDARHFEIHENHIGLEAHSLGNDFVPTRDFSGNFDARFHT